MVHNYMEHLVDLYYHDVLKDSDEFKSVCTCEICEQDIKARALNQLRPYYVTTKRGEVFAEYANLQTQYKADVFGALARSIQFINANKKCGN